MKVYREQRGVEKDGKGEKEEGDKGEVGEQEKESAMKNVAQYCTPDNS